MVTFNLLLKPGFNNKPRNIKMTTLALDRSTDTQSIALSHAGEHASRVWTDMDARSADWPARICAFLNEYGLDVHDLDQVVVGQGPGSFAGIRSALAFAQGLSFGLRTPPLCVRGLPSSLALTRAGARVAVVGDARRERFWVILYEGTRTVRDFVLVSQDELARTIPDDFHVVTSDGARIGTLLETLFTVRYKGSLVPLAARLLEVAEHDPALLTSEPLPIYLSQAVRPSI